MAQEPQGKFFDRVKSLDLYALLMGDVAEYVCVWVTQIKAALFLVVVKGV